MKCLLILSLLAIAAIQPPAILVDALYSGEVRVVLDYLNSCSPTAYQFAQQNINRISVIETQRGNSGAADYNPSGLVTISAYLFQHPEIYFPNNDMNFNLALLIVHEARHEWQFNHRWLEMHDPAARPALEQDAIDFAKSLLSPCR